ncbi:MAG: hypothetical protein JSS81_07015 [Acidobacteria bacterium]|nr:hypothetical protein [Acidobacteriota bacterium]
MIEEIFNRCVENAPNFGVSLENYKDSLRKTIRKFINSSNREVSAAELTDFLNQIHADDLLLAIGCANGNERAWWEFDQNHRKFLERGARHLANTDADARDVVDTVYIELYGTRVVDGERVSKFSTYSGRGSIRGWLRTVIWHSLVDLHRAAHEEISLDEMTETMGEGQFQAFIAEEPPDTEIALDEKITVERYRPAVVSSIEKAFSTLEAHEKLLLLYYHAESLKLREIARLIENPASPMRGWFQRKSASREKNPETRVHESTIMRWLEKSYSKVLQTFLAELRGEHKLRENEVAICLELIKDEIANRSIFQSLKPT